MGNIDAKPCEMTGGTLGEIIIMEVYMKTLYNEIYFSYAYSWVDVIDSSIRAVVETYEACYDMDDFFTHEIENIYKTVNKFNKRTLLHSYIFIYFL